MLVRAGRVGESGRITVATREPTAAARRLLEGLLDSYEKLEIAIALHRADARSLSVAELGSKLQLPSNIVERGIDELSSAGVVRLANGVATSTMDPRDIPAMDEIVALHEDDRLLLVRTLTEIAMDKIRGMTARAFADAFKLRRKKEDDRDA